MSVTRHPKWGLYTYISVFYLAPQMRWWGESLPDLRWSLIAAAATALSLSKCPKPAGYPEWSSHTLAKLYIAYVVYMWVQCIWGNPLHMIGLILQTKYLLLFYLFYRIILSEQDLKEFALVHVLGCLYFGVLALEASDAGRLEYVGGPGANDSNTLGMHLSCGLLFAGSLVLSGSGWYRWIALAAAPLIANGIIQTESRGAFLGLVVGGAAFYLFSPKRKRKYIAVLGVLSVVVLVFNSPAVYWERIATMGRASESVASVDKSSESRIVIIKAQFEMFFDYPFGLGFYTTDYLSRDYLAVEWLTAAHGKDVTTQGGRSSHNTLMAALVDQGVPGAIIALLTIITVTSSAFRFRRQRIPKERENLELYRACIVGSLACVFIAGLFANYIKAEVQLWSLALLISALEITKCYIATGAAPSDLPKNRISSRPSAFADEPDNSLPDRISGPVGHHPNNSL